MDPHDQPQGDAIDITDESEFNAASENQAGPGDSVMGMIAGVEERIGQLRRLHDEQRKAAEALVRSRSEIETERARVHEDRHHLEELARELADREEGVRRRDAEFEARAGQVAQREARLAEEESRFAAKERETTELAQRLERERAELNDRLTRAQAEVDARWKRIDERQSKLEQMQAALDERLDEARQRDAELIDREAELRELNISAERVEELEHRLGQREKIIAELRDQAERFDEELVGARDALLRAGGAAEQLGQERARNAALREEVADLRKQLERLGDGADLEAARAQVDDLQAELEVARAKLEQTASAAAERVATERSNTEQLRAELIELGRLRDEGHGAAAAARERLEHLEQQLSEAREELADAGRQAEDRAAELQVLSDEIEGLRRRAEEAEALAQRLREAGDGAGTEQSVRVASLEAELEAVQRQLRETAEAAAERLAEQQDRVAQLEGELAELNNDERVRDLEGRVGSLQTELDQTHELLDRASRHAEQRSADDQAALASLSQRASEAAKRAEALQRRVDELELTPRDDAWTGLRRERLRRQRALLREQSTKLRRATKALRDRLDQVEQVLSRRAELAEAYQAVADAEGRLSRREARNGSVLLVCAIVTIIGVLGALSWFISGVVNPGVHAATATVVADAGNRKLTEADKTGWQAYIEGLLADPAFLESVADRMKRRGIATLATAGAMRSLVTQDLDIQSPESGVVQFELRGEGRSRMERVMDTYVVALASTANHARSRRTDGATTVVTAGAAVRTDPLDTTRLYTAGAMFGGASLATVLLGGLLWRRMTETKAKFERSARVEMILDESGWADPRKGD